MWVQEWMSGLCIRSRVEIECQVSSSPLEAAYLGRPTELWNGRPADELGYTYLCVSPRDETGKKQKSVGIRSGKSETAENSTKASIEQWNGMRESGETILLMNGLGENTNQRTAIENRRPVVARYPD